ncbi:MAG: AgmX/PglI C-terminal domain-containing protein [Polyangiaceae bacterium]
MSSNPNDLSERSQVNKHDAGPESEPPVRARSANRTLAIGVGLLAIAGVAATLLAMDTRSSVPPQSSDSTDDSAGEGASSATTAHPGLPSNSVAFLASFHSGITPALVLSRRALTIADNTVSIPSEDGLFPDEVEQPLRGLVGSLGAVDRVDIHLQGDALFASLFDLASRLRRHLANKDVTIKIVLDGRPARELTLMRMKPVAQPRTHVIVTDRGVLLDVDGVRLGASCASGSQGPDATPFIASRGPSGLDLAALAACVRAQNAGVLASDAKVSIGGAGPVLAAEVVAVADALRGDTGALLFEDAWLDAFDCRSDGQCASRSFEGGMPELGAVARPGSVVAGLAAGFRRCYQKGLADDPDSKGKLKVTVKLGPDGDVLSAEATSVTGLSETVVRCIVAHTVSAKFAAPDGGGKTIVVPIDFTPR